jgi:hypothetical protein
VRAETVATHVFVNPLVAVALGAWLGGERLQPAHFVSGLLILCSVSILTLGARRGRARLAPVAAPVDEVDAAVAARIAPECQAHG